MIINVAIVYAAENNQMNPALKLLISRKNSRIFATSRSSLNLIFVRNIHGNVTELIRFSWERFRWIEFWSYWIFLYRIESHKNLLQEQQQQKKTTISRMCRKNPAENP